MNRGVCLHTLYHRLPKFVSDYSYTWLLFQRKNYRESFLIAWAYFLLKLSVDWWRDARSSIRQSIATKRYWKLCEGRHYIGKCSPCCLLWQSCQLTRIDTAIGRARELCMCYRKWCHVLPSPLVLCVPWTYDTAVQKFSHPAVLCCVVLVTSWNVVLSISKKGTDGILMTLVIQGCHSRVHSYS